MTRSVDPMDSIDSEIARVDEEVFLEITEVCGHDAKFLGELVDAFVDRAEALGGLCHEAIAIADRDQVTTLAHEIKSSSGQLGALRLQALARELERRATEGDDDLRPLADRLIVEIELASAALIEIKDSLGTESHDGKRTDC